MLAPISAISAADVSFPSTDLKQENTQSSAISANSMQAEPNNAAKFAGAAVRAASGEFQLSQNVSILASALGTLLNIPRMDNETSEAYVNRLVMTMQTLPAEQKALLEQQIGKLINGLTFSILLDVLKNSAGPEAARLAAAFELIQENEAYPIGRSAYLQDLTPSNADLVSSGPGNPPARQVTASSAIAYPYAASPETSMEPASQPQFSESKAPIEKAANDPINKIAAALTTQLVALEQQVTAAKETPQGEPPRLPTSNIFEGMDGMPNRPISVGPSGEEALAPSERTVIVTERPRSVQAAEMADADRLEQVRQNWASNAPSLNPQISGYDPAIIRQQFYRASATQIEKFLLSALMGTLKAEAQAPLTLASLPPAPVQAEETPQKSLTLPQMAARQTDGYPLQQSPNLENEVELQAAHRAAVAADIRSALTDTPALQWMVAAVITKEGTPLPFVHYPPDKDEPESDSPPRGRWPSSSGENADPEDQHGQHNKDETPQEERVAANDPEEDLSQSEGASEDGRVGDAEFYYLKMSNFI